MADWIKIEKTLPDKLEVLQLAGLLGISEDEVVGKLFRFWCWVDSNLKTCNADGVTFVTLDRIANCSGFAAGLVKVGWLKGREGRLLIPNFDRHFGQTAKTRAVTNKRVKAYREGAKNTPENCNATSVTPVTPQALPDKIREEDNKTTHTPRADSGSVQALPRSVDEVLAYMLSMPHCGLQGPEAEECSRKFFDSGEECGWLTKNGLPVNNWHASLRKWVQSWQQHDTHPAAAPSGGSRLRSGGATPRQDGVAKPAAAPTGDNPQKYTLDWQ